MDDTMEKKRPGDFPKVVLFKILMLLPVVSLLRFKSVCKSWLSLIQSPYFVDSHTTVTTLKSSLSNFGSFILHAELEFSEFTENALFMLSSESESESETGSVPWYSQSLGLCKISFNGFCGRCGSFRVSPQPKSAGCGWWWRTLCCECLPTSNSCVKESDLNMVRFFDGMYLDQQQQQQLVLKLGNIGFPQCYLFGKKPKVMVVGSCNGVICLHDSERSNVSLWNPATRQFRTLPKYSSLPSLFAFGFNAETKDYQVVLLSGFTRQKIIIDDDGLSRVPVPMECVCSVEVYNLNTDSWKVLKGITCLPGDPFQYPTEVLYLNGTCFFMAKFLTNSQLKNNYRFLISLDLTKEIIIPIKLPYQRPAEELYLSYLGNKITLFSARKVYRHEGICIWVLDEHWSSYRFKDESCWRELHFFDIKCVFPDEWIIPRGISNDGMFALLETGIHNKKKMLLYNLATYRLEKNFITCNQVLSKAYAYKPSLVSISGGGFGISGGISGVGDRLCDFDRFLQWVMAGDRLCDLDRFLQWVIAG